MIVRDVHVKSRGMQRASRGPIYCVPWAPCSTHTTMEPNSAEYLFNDIFESANTYFGYEPSAHDNPGSDQSYMQGYYDGGPASSNDQNWVPSGFTDYREPLGYDGSSSSVYTASSSSQEYNLQLSGNDGWHGSELGDAFTNVARRNSHYIFLLD